MENQLIDENKRIRELLLNLELIKDKLINILDNYKSCESCQTINNIKREEINQLLKKYNVLKDFDFNYNINKTELKTEFKSEIINNYFDENSEVIPQRIQTKAKRRRGRPKKSIQIKETVDETETKCEVNNKCQYICEWPQCNQQFIKKSLLVKHRFSHSCDKPFACDWIGCSFRSTRSSTLVYSIIHLFIYNNNVFFCFITHSMHHIRNHKVLLIQMKDNIEKYKHLMRFKY
jgi:hypothetical protein